MKEKAAAPETHETVLDLVKQAVGDLRGLRVCDVPCGRGAMSAELQRLGAGVTSIDIAPSEPYLADAAQRVLHDVDNGLPLPTGSFDVVVSIEGIEHVEAPRRFLAECARVLRRGGWLFLTTPNVDSLRSRWEVFSRGHHRYFSPVSLVEKEAGHLHPIDMVFVHGAAARAGFAVDRFTVNRIVGRTWWKELLRPWLTRKLPASMRGRAPFYGDVAIYALRKRVVEAAGIEPASASPTQSGLHA